MKRVQAFQLSRQNWFPQHLKVLIAEFLTWFVGKVKATKPFVPLLNEAAQHSKSKQIVNLDFGFGAGIESLKPWLNDEWEIDNLFWRDIHFEKEGIYTMINGFHSLKPKEAINLLQKLADNQKIILVLEGNNNNWWQAIGMSVFVPITVLLTGFFVKPFRPSRILFTYFMPILPILISLDGLAALFKLYGPSDLNELKANVKSPNYQWVSGKRDNGRGGEVIFLLGYPIN